MYKRLGKVAAVVGGAVVSAQMAVAQAALPSTGVDVEDYIALMVTALGVVVASVVGAYIAFLLIRKGLKWARTPG